MRATCKSSSSPCLKCMDMANAGIGRSFCMPSSS